MNDFHWGFIVGAVVSPMLLGAGFIEYLIAYAHLHEESARPVRDAVIELVDTLRETLKGLRARALRWQFELWQVKAIELDDPGVYDIATGDKRER